MNDNNTGPSVIAFARRTDPGTSHEAAEAVTLRLRKLQLEVLAFAGLRGRFTDPQLGEYFGDHGSTRRTRRGELVRLGLIEDSGHRVGDRGHRHTVWQITEAGRAMLGEGRPSAA